MGRRFAPLELDEVERAELTALASRRSTAQALALRARIILACADGEQSKVVWRPEALDLSIPTNGWRQVDVPARPLCQPIADQRRLVGCVIVHDELTRSSGTPLALIEELARNRGAIVRTLADDPAPSRCRVAACSAGASGAVSLDSTAQRALARRMAASAGFAPMPDLRLRSPHSTFATFVGLYVAPPSVAILVDESRRSGLRPCRSPADAAAGRRRRAVVTTTSATAPHRCLPPSTSQPAGSSASVTGAIAPKSSASFSMRSKPLFQTIWTSISSWTITQPTRRR